METGSLDRPDTPSPYGSARDLPIYQELSQLIAGGKLLTLFIARNQRKELREIQSQMDRLTGVVDAFYQLLGPRNWVFHEALDVSKIEAILDAACDPEDAEARLIELYQDDETSRFWFMRLRSFPGLRERFHQIERAKEHYDDGQYDSCVLHLIAVMDGFVSDFQPDRRKGLHARDPDEVVAWNSVVGHHLGLSHALNTFLKTIYKRIDEEVFEVYRHGIMHGTVVNFNNPIVATKAWNMLFAVVDWATATRKAAEPKEPEPSWREVWSKMNRQAAYKNYREGFVPSTITPTDPGFETDPLVQRAVHFLEAWQHGRWGLVADFAPTQLLGSKSEKQAARYAKEVFEGYVLESWELTAVSFDQASSVEIQVRATVNGLKETMRFRMVLWAKDGNVGMRDDEGATWRLAVWAPHTFLKKTSDG